MKFKKSSTPNKPINKSPVAGIQETALLNNGCTEKIKAINKAVRFRLPNFFNKLYNAKTVRMCSNTFER